jgi:hypothetical protein
MKQFCNTATSNYCTQFNIWAKTTSDQPAADVVLWFAMSGQVDDARRDVHIHDPVHNLQKKQRPVEKCTRIPVPGTVVRQRFRMLYNCSEVGKHFFFKFIPVLVYPISVRFLNRYWYRYRYMIEKKKSNEIHKCWKRLWKRQLKIVQK